MTAVELNLSAALDALLAEGGVAGAARQLGLNASAMSRTLAPTPRAEQLRDRVREATHEALARVHERALELCFATSERG